MSQFPFGGSPNLQCPVTTSTTSSAASPSGATSSPTTTTSASSSSTTHPHHPLSVRMAVTSSAVVRPPGGSPTAVASESSSQPGSGNPPPPGSAGPPTSSSAAPPGGRCCDTGRPIFTDPITGQTVCSCQYELLGGYQRLGALPTAALSMYSAPYAAAAAAAASEGMAAYFPGLAADQAPFYSPTAAGLELKENLGAGAAAAWPYPSVYHPYDAAFAGYPFNGYGMDLNGARRKNATRETTSTLKAWLNEHKKNPYPTKGEKIMLAIITKMTLTQVSTWFANARRRLKKENKMTWEPRNRVEDEDNNNDDDDSGRKSVDEKDRLDSKDSGTGSSEDGERGGSASHRLDLLHGSGGGGLGGSHHGADREWSESRADSGPDSPECLYEQRDPPRHHIHHPLHQMHHPAFMTSSPHHPAHNRLSSSPASTSTSATSATTKPRIWSLADMASKDGDSTSPNTGGILGSPYAGSNNGGGKIVSPLASRLPHPLHPAMHPGSQFVRPHPDFYRNFYAAPHLAAGDMSLLETYQRTFGVMPPTSAAPSLLASSSAMQPKAFNGSTAPVPQLSTVSPSSSSASSNGSPNPGLAELKSPGRV